MYLSLQQKLIEKRKKKVINTFANAIYILQTGYEYKKKTVFAYPF